MAENNKTRFFYVLYSDKTRVFDQSEGAYYPIYIINIYIYIYIYIYTYVFFYPIFRKALPSFIRVLQTVAFGNWNVTI